MRKFIGLYMAYRQQTIASHGCLKTCKNCPNTDCLARNEWSLPGKSFFEPAVEGLSRPFPAIYAIQNARPQTKVLHTHYGRLQADCANILHRQPNPSRRT